MPIDNTNQLINWIQRALPHLPADVGGEGNKLLEHLVASPPSAELSGSTMPMPLPPESVHSGQNPFPKAESAADWILQSPLPAAVLHPAHGTILQVNRPGLELLAAQPSEISGKQFLRFVRTLEEWAELKQVQEQMLPGQAVVRSAVMRSLEGKTFPAEIHYFKPAQAQAEEMVVSFCEVADRTDGRAQLLAELDRYRSLFDNGADAYLVVDLWGAAGPAFLAINEMACRLLRKTHGELMSMTPSAALELEILDDPGELERRIMETGHFRATSVLSQLEDRTVHVEANLHRIQYSGHEAVLIVARDVTAEVKSRLVLEKSEARFRELFDNNPNMCFILDQSFRITEVNQVVPDTLQYPRHYFLEKSIAEVMVRGDGQRISELLEDHMKRPDGICECEFRQAREDGSELWIAARVKRISSQNGEDSILMVCDDISAQKNAEGRLKDSLKVKEILLKEVHHRVKNNLQIIQSLLNFQARKIDLPEVNQAFTDSQSRIQSMALIHENLYNSGDLARIMPEAYIQQLATQLFRTYQSDGQTIRKSIQVQAPMIAIDLAIPFGLILNELITNALKYAYGATNPSGQLDIRFNGVPKGFQLHVQDNGPGIHQEILSGNQPGSLGLKLVRTLVRQLNGTINIDNSNGTAIDIFFPNH